jgi:hypothetical protein
MFRDELYVFVKNEKGAVVAKGQDGQAGVCVHTPRNSGIFHGCP